MVREGLIVRRVRLHGNETVEDPEGGHQGNSAESLRKWKWQDLVDMEWEQRAMRLPPRFLAKMTKWMMAQLAKISDSGGAGLKANMMGLNMTSLWAVLVEMSQVSEHGHVWLSEEFWLMKGRSFKKEIVVHIVFPFRDHEKEDLKEIHCF